MLGWINALRSISFFHFLNLLSYSLLSYTKTNHSLYYHIFLESYCDSVLGSCVAHDEWESVLEVLDIMKRHNLMQERSTYRACLQACLETGNGASAREILQAMQKALLVPTPWDIGLTVAAMCRQDTTWWRRALALLKSSAMNPQIVTDASNVIPPQAYDVILECMVEEKQWKEAVRLLRLMEDASVTKESRPEAGYHPAPVVSTYREVIECCVGSNQAEQAAQVLSSMKDRGVKVCVKIVRSNCIVRKEFLPVPCETNTIDQITLSKRRIQLSLTYFSFFVFCYSQQPMPVNSSSLPCRKNCSGDELCNSWISWMNSMFPKPSLPTMPSLVPVHDLERWAWPRVYSPRCKRLESVPMKSRSILSLEPVPIQRNGEMPWPYLTNAIGNRVSNPTFIFIPTP